MSSYGVFIGVNQFQHFPGHSLRYCEADAIGFSEALKNNDCLLEPLEDANCSILTSTNGNATRSAILVEMERQFSRASHRDHVWLYIASHGYEFEGANYIMTSDTQDGTKELRSSTSLALSTVRTMLSKCNAKRKSVFLDVCHAASADFYRSLGQTRDGLQPSPFSIRDAICELEGQGAVFYFSCAPTESSHESEQLKHGLWTYWLIRAFSGENSAVDSDGFLTTESLQKYLYHNVSSHASSNLNATQTPHQELFITSGFSYSESKSKDNRKSIVELSEVKLQAYANAIKKLFSTKLGPLLSEVGHIKVVENLTRQIDEIIHLLTSKEDIPIAILGGTGVGKTALLNALSNAVIGISGAGDIQSGAPLVIRSNNKNEFEARVELLGNDKISSMLKDAISNSKEGIDYALLPHEQGIDDASKAMIKLIFPDYNFESPSNNPTFDDDMIEKAVLDKVESIVKKIRTPKSKAHELTEFISRFTHCSGDCWQLTSKVTVEGPFTGFSPGVSIIDLPGTRDMSLHRSEMTRKYLKQANQVIVVTTDRGLESDIFEELHNAGFIADLISNPRRAQILVIGTKLDTADNQGDTIKYKTEDPVELLKARMAEWPVTAQAKWEERIGKYISNKEERKEFLNTIRAKVYFLPALPPAYLDISRISQSILMDYSRIIGRGSKSDKLDRTGVPRVRDSIETLAKDSKSTKHCKLAIRVAEIENQIFEKTKLALRSLSSSVDASISDKRKLTSAMTQVRDICLSWCRDYSLKDISIEYDDVSYKVDNGLNKAWGDLNSDHIRKLLDKHIGRLGSILYWLHLRGMENMYLKEG